jgi:RHS repeat-associated protein
MAVIGVGRTGVEYRTIDIVRTGIGEMWPGNPDFWLKYDNVFRLIMNGASYDLQPASGSEDQLYGRYYADDMPGLYVERINSCSNGNCNDLLGGSPANVTTEYWIVKTSDGTTYRLGYQADAEQVIFRTANDGGQSYPYSGPVWAHTAYRWRVDLVTDIHGNTTIYQYKECRTGGTNCAVFPSGPSEQREIASYPYKIFYNQVGSSWLAEVEFISVQKGESPAVNSGPVFATRQRLNSIRVKWAGSLVKEYVLDYDEYYTPSAAPVFLLKQIRPYGLGGESSGDWLPSPSFYYTEFDNKDWCSWNPLVGCITQWHQERFPYERLTEVRNGYGGRTVFVYESDGPGRGDWWQGFYNYRVTEKHTYDGLNGLVRKEIYTYGTPCYDQYGDNWPATGGSNCPSPGTEGNGPLVGHDHVTVTATDAGGVPMRVTEYDFHVTGSYALRGRAYETRQFAANGTTLLAREQNIYGVNDSVCLISGLPTSAVFSCLKESISTLYDPENSNSQTTRQVYFYDPTKQQGVQYGRQTGVDVYDETNTRQRISQNLYAVNTSNWVIVPIKNATWDGAWNLSASTLSLYDGSMDPDSQTIDKGQLTLTRARLIPSGASCTTGATNQTVDTAFNYDTAGNLTTTKSYPAYGWVYCYGGAWTGWSTAGNGSAARITTIDYDNNNLFPETTTNPLGQATAIQYDSGLPWLPDHITAPNGAQTTAGFDAFGRPWKLWQPDPATGQPNFEAIAYDYGDENPPPPLYQVTPPLPIDQVIAGQHSSLTTTSRSFYNGLGQVVQQRSFDPALTTITWVHNQYDALGRLTCQTAPQPGGSTGYFTKTCANEPHTTTTYDDLGRVKTVTTPDGESSYAHYGIDAAGLTFTDAIDPNGHRTRQYHDGLGRLVRVKEYSGNCSNDGWAVAFGLGCGGGDTPWAVYATTSYSYDSLDNLRQVIDEAGNVTSMEYDTLGRKISMDDPDMGSWSYGYDPAGSLVRQTDAKSQRLCFYFDAGGRPSGKYRNGTGSGDCPVSPAGTLLASYTYHSTGPGKGLVQTISGGSGDSAYTDTFVYDYRGRVSQQSRTIGGSGFTSSLGYDLLDRPTTLTYPGGEMVTTTYDERGLPDSLASSATYVEQATYNFAGQLKSLALGNGLTTWYGYHGYEASGNHDAYDAREVTWYWGANHAFGRLWRTCTEPDGSTRCLAANKDLPLSGQRQDMRLDYGANGNVTASRDKVNSSQVQSFTYDHLDRLASGATDGVGAGLYDHAYSYDKLGNIQSVTRDGTIYNYHYDPSQPHAVTTVNTPAAGEGSAPPPVPVFSLGYDANGNMDTRTDHAAGITYDQNFDVENRLEEVIDSGSNTRTTFAYDASGQRIMTTVESVGPPVPDSQRTITYYPFPQYEKELQQSWQCVDKLCTAYDWVTTAAIQRSTYFLGGQVIATRVTTSPPASGDGLYYIHGDHLGSTSLLTNSSGAVVSGSAARHYPFGDYRTTPTQTITDRGFTGHRQNNLGSNGIGLIYMGARFYVPSLGRFASADSLVPDPANPQSFNRFSYVNNRTLNFSDPSGHCGGDPADPYDSEVDWDCWNYASTQFCLEGLCEHWSDWLIIDDENIWTTELLRAVRETLLGAQTIARTARVSLKSLVDSELRFEPGDECEADIACYQPDRQRIIVEDPLVDGFDIAIFYLGHELGHAAGVHLAGSIDNAGRRYRNVHPEHTGLRQIWRGYWLQAGVGEMWADAFGATVYSSYSGNDIPFAENAGWQHGEPPRTERFREMYATVVDVIQLELLV